MCSTLRLALLAKELNLSCVVSTGNEAQLTTEDFLAFLIDDAATQVVVLFMEEVRDPALVSRRSPRARANAKSRSCSCIPAAAPAPDPRRAPIPAPWSATMR